MQGTHTWLFGAAGQLLVPLAEVDPQPLPVLEELRQMRTLRLEVGAPHIAELEAVLALRQRAERLPDLPGAVGGNARRACAFVSSHTTTTMRPSRSFQIVKAALP